MPILTPHINRRYATTKGHIVVLKQGVAMDVAKDLYDELLSEGFAAPGEVTITSTVAEAEPQSLDPDKLNRIKEAMELILEEGEEEKLTSDGEPRANEVNALVGEKTTKEEREAAWDMIKSA